MCILIRNLKDTVSHPYKRKSKIIFLLHKQENATMDTTCDKALGIKGK